LVAKKRNKTKGKRKYNGDIDQEMKKEKENNKKDFEIAISVAYRK